MRKIVINTSVCRGCLLCRKSCRQKAIKVYGDKAHIGEECVGCGQCLRACPFHAISQYKT